MMTKADLIAAMADLPDNAPVLIVPNPAGGNPGLMMDDLPGTAYGASAYLRPRDTQAGAPIDGAFIALSPVVR